MSTISNNNKNLKNETYYVDVEVKLNDVIDIETHIDQLFESGLDDAAIGVGKKGYLGLSYILDVTEIGEKIPVEMAKVKTVFPNAEMVTMSRSRL